MPALAETRATVTLMGGGELATASIVEPSGTRRRTNILVADDDPASRMAMESILGDLDQRLAVVSSGEEALRLMLDDDFAVVILDVRMPGLNGYETARYIRERKRTEHTPIIFLTGMGADDGDVFAGYFAGAVDFLTKPVVPHVLRAKVKVFVDLYLAWEEVKRQSELLRQNERRELERQLAEERAQHEAERLRRDMNLAARIQQRLFPKEPPRYDGFDIFGDSRSADSTGGDYYDFFPVGEHLGLAIGDACGHGIASALTMASMRAYVRALALGNLSPARVLQLANEALSQDAADGNFATLTLAKIDAVDRVLTYSGAGHPPGYLLSSDGEIKDVLNSQSPPLGIQPAIVFPEAAVSLSAGDVLLFVTDGILEATNAKGDLYGIRRTLATLRAHIDKPARAITLELYKAARRFASGGLLQDDATSIVVKVN